MIERSFGNLFRLDAKVAVVTGAVGILGKRFCAGLAEAGAKVAVVDLDAEATLGFAADLSESFGVDAAGFACDVSVPESVTRLVQDIVARFGAIHVLHNNAAGKSDDLDALFAPYESYEPAQWRKIMAVNLDGMFLVSQAVGGQMVRQGTGGSIVQTSSIYGIMAPDQRIYEGSEYMGRAINTPAVYSASKAGVVGLTKYLATYWAGKGIRVNTITPGGVESGQNEEFRRKYSQRVPMARMANRDEMVGALIFLASDASSYVTGHNLVVDGGLSAW